MESSRPSWRRWVWASIRAWACGVIWGLGIGCQTKELASAKVHLQQHNWNEAVVALEKTVAGHPENAEAQFLLGQGYALQKRFAEMNRAFTASLALSPQFALEIKFWRQKYFSENFNAGIKAVGADNFSAAVAAFAAAAIIDASQTEVYRQLAYAHARSGDFAKAGALYQNLLANNPADWETALAAADLYRQQQEYEKSAAVLEQALRQNPRQAKILAALAESYDCLGKHDEALAAYQQALAIVPEDKELLLNLARFYLAKNDYAHAILQYANLLRLEPENFAANYNIGLSYLKTGERLQELPRAPTAPALASKAQPPAAVDSFPTQPLIREALRNFKTAVPFLLKAAQLDTLHAGAYFNLGAGYARLGEVEKAKAAFKRSEQLQEKH